MNIKKLSDVAFIDISGVDKKTNNQEKSVRLCNFTDVYYNWAVSKDNIDSFMVASANDNEINRFLLKKGSVAITKDSETRNDIGMSCYIADDLDNTLLGYHCALIVPNNKVLNGKYLNAFLNSKTARKYFSNQASGSGQRYTLSISGIGAIKIPIIPLYNQEKIGNIFSYIDRKILNNNEINTYLEELVKTIYDYWFLQFEFPNEEGRPYKSSGGKMVYNEQLKREIPEGWEVKSIKNVSDLVSGYSFKTKDFVSNGKYKIYTIKNVQDGYIDNKVDNLINFLPSDINPDCILKYGDLLMSLTGNVGRVGLVYEGNALLNQRVLKIKTKEQYFNYIYLTFRQYSFKVTMQKISGGTSQKNLSPSQVADYKIVIPSKSILNEFNNKLNNYFNEMIFNLRENQELSSLRDFLLPLLINGQATFKEEHEKEKKQISALSYIERFNYWKQIQGYALRGNADDEILKQIYDAMDEDDKK